MIGRSARQAQHPMAHRVDLKVTEMQKQDSLSRAKRQVEAIKGFYIHLYSCRSSPCCSSSTPPPQGQNGVQWPFLGWGVGILGHALTVFGSSPGIVARWEQRKIEALKRSLDASEPVVGEVPKPLVTATTELPIVDRTAR